MRVACFDHQSLIGLAIVHADVLPVKISAHVPVYLNTDEEVDRTGGFGKSCMFVYKNSFFLIV
jgi:hypothetical protein